MKTYRYKLASNKVKKLDCPYCRAKKHWQRYIDFQRGEIMPPEFGRCDNAVKCGQHIKPNFNIQNLTAFNSIERINIAQNIEEAYIPHRVLKATIRNYKCNPFYSYLSRFNTDAKLVNTLKLYLIGTLNDLGVLNGVTFPFINSQGQITAIQVKSFNSYNHTLNTGFLHSKLKYYYDQNKIDYPTWLAKYLKHASANRVINALFGEHLLAKFPNHPIGVVEAPKTAIYATLFFGTPTESPKNLVWVSVYNINGINERLCKPLKGRDVIFFPDLSENNKARILWEHKAKVLNDKIGLKSYQVSKFLEEYADNNSQKEGLDLADFIDREWK